MVRKMSPTQRAQQDVHSCPRLHQHNSLRAQGCHRACALLAAAIALATTTPRAQADSAFGYHLGVNAAGLEFAEGSFPGTVNVNYVVPTTPEVGYYASKGMRIVRLPFAWERLQPTLNGPFNTTYLSYIQQTVATIRSNGMMVILDPHNYSMYRPSGQNRHHIGSTAVPVAAFIDLWMRLATLYKQDAGVVFGLMNEPVQWDDYGEELRCTEWAGYCNQVIAAIRDPTSGAGATQNWILVPGNFWTGAWSWTSVADSQGATNATAMLAVTDSAGKFAFEVHQYLDANQSGTSDTCTASHPSDLLSSFTSWLRSHGRIGFLGEIGAGSNSDCYDNLSGALDYLYVNSDVWSGWTYWVSCQWNVQFNLEPTNWVGHTAQQQAGLTPVDPQ